MQEEKRKIKIYKQYLRERNVKIMKILITGANGMLAKSVRARLKEGNELICTDVANLDITDEEAVMKFVEENKPE